MYFYNIIIAGAGLVRVGFGAAIGALIGSIVPGPGTLIGAAVGATIGGFITAKKMHERERNLKLELKPYDDYYTEYVESSMDNNNIPGVVEPNYYTELQASIRSSKGLSSRHSSMSVMDIEDIEDHSISSINFHL